MTLKPAIKPARPEIFRSDQFLSYNTAYPFLEEFNE
jgi:hypothetical protein